MQNGKLPDAPAEDAGAKKSLVSGQPVYQGAMTQGVGTQMLAREKQTRTHDEK